MSQNRKEGDHIHLGMSKLDPHIDAKSTRFVFESPVPDFGNIPFTSNRLHQEDDKISFIPTNPNRSFASDFNDQPNLILGSTVPNFNLLRESVRPALMQRAPKDIENFMQVVPITVVSPIKEISKKQLTVKMLWGQKNTKPSVIVRITDDQDLQFIKIMEMTESDFQVIKAEQNLRFDFPELPKMFFGLIDFCCHPQKNSNSSTFGCTLEHSLEGESRLRISEQTNLKDNELLLLSFQQPDDSFVKRYLSDCLAISKKNEKTLQAHIAELEIEVKKVYEHEKALQIDYLNIKEKKTELALSYEARLKEAHNELNQELINEKKRLIDEREQLKKAHELTLLEKDKTYQSKQHEYVQLIEEMNVKISGLSAREKELGSRIVFMEKENSVISRELEATRLKSTELETKIFQKDSELVQTKMSLGIYEASIKDKEEFKRHFEDQQRQVSQTVVKLEEQLEEIRKHKQKLEAKLYESTNIINDGNKKLEKLDNKIQQKRAEIKELRSIVIQQEKSIRAANENICALQKQVEQLKSGLQLKEVELLEARAVNTDSMTKITELAKTIHENQNTIEYLNKRINENKQFKSTFITHNVSGANNNEYMNTISSSGMNRLDSKLSPIGQRIFETANIGLSKVTRGEETIDSQYDFLVSKYEKAPYHPKRDFDADPRLEEQKPSHYKALREEIHGLLKVSGGTNDDLLKTVRAQQSDFTKTVISEHTVNLATDPNTSFEVPIKPNFLPISHINPVSFNPKPKN